MKDQIGILEKSYNDENITGQQRGRGADIRVAGTGVLGMRMEKSVENQIWMVALTSH